MAILYVQLLGDFRLMYGDMPVAGINQTRLQSLLAYLVLHRGAPQARHHLAFLFWPDSTEAQARTNLRKALLRLRRALPDADRFWLVGGTTLQWRPDAPFWLDVADFEDTLAQAKQLEQAGDQRAVLTFLQRAV